MFRKGPPSRHFGIGQSTQAHHVPRVVLPPIDQVGALGRTKPKPRLKVRVVVENDSPEAVGFAGVVVEVQPKTDGVVEIGSSLKIGDIDGWVLRRKDILIGFLRHQDIQVGLVPSVFNVHLESAIRSSSFSVHFHDSARQRRPVAHISIHCDAGREGGIDHRCGCDQLNVPRVRVHSASRRPRVGPDKRLPSVIIENEQRFTPKGVSGLNRLCEVPLGLASRIHRSGNVSPRHRDLDRAVVFRKGPPSRHFGIGQSTQAHHVPGVVLPRIDQVGAPSRTKPKPRLKVRVVVENDSPEAVGFTGVVVEVQPKTDGVVKIGSSLKIGDIDGWVLRRGQCIVRVFFDQNVKVGVIPRVLNIDPQVTMGSSSFRVHFGITAAKLGPVAGVPVDGNAARVLCLQLHSLAERLLLVAETEQSRKCESDCGKALPCGVPDLSKGVRGYSHDTR